MESVTMPVKSTQDAAQSANGGSNVDEMKNIRKAKLQRKVMQDPSLARKLVSMEASPVYNAKGTISAALSSTNMEV